MTDQYVRGATIHFKGPFLDTDGNIANPTSAKLYVAYLKNGARTESDPIDLVANGDTWSATWDSSVADHGSVFWHVRSDGSDKAAQDGTFILLANPANPAPPAPPAP